MVGQSGGALGTAGIGRDDDGVPPVGDLLLDVRHHGWLGEEVVDGDVEKALDLGGVEVHCDDVVGAGDGEEVGDEPGKGLAVLHILSLPLDKNWAID